MNKFFNDKVKKILLVVLIVLVIELSGRGINGFYENKNINTHI